MTNARILGVLGGMGPLAGATFMQRLTLLTPADRDQDHIPSILWSDPRVPDRTAARLSGGEDPLPWLLRACDRKRPNEKLMFVEFTVSIPPPPAPDGPAPTPEDAVIRDLGIDAATLSREVIGLELDGEVTRHPGGFLSRG